MKRNRKTIAIATLLFFDHANIALAGMPSVTLSDVARMGIQSISFFLLVFLVCSWVVRRIWNGAERLSLAAVALVSPGDGPRGALGPAVRTGAHDDFRRPRADDPSAWTKEGFTYKLKDESPASKPAESTANREARRPRADLKAALWTYAKHHDGHFPPSNAVPEIPDDAWRIPDPSGMRYVYTPASSPMKVLAAGIRAGRLRQQTLCAPGRRQILLMDEDELSSTPRKAP